MPIFILTGTILLLYHTTIRFLFNLWTDFEFGEFSHGLVIVLISFFILVKQARNEQNKIPVKVDLYLVILLALFGIVWALASNVNVHMVESLMVLAIFAVGTFAFTPRGSYKKILFPVFYLFLAAPVWLPLLPVLQNITIFAVGEMLNIAGVSYYLEDYVFHVDSGSFAVEFGCSGLRYFLAAFALSTLYGFYYFRTFKVFTLFVSLALLIAIVANWVRVFLVVYMGYKTAMTHPWVKEHITMGWYLFSGTLLPYLWFGYSWFKKWDTTAVQSSGAESTSNFTENKKTYLLSNGVPINKPVTLLLILSMGIGPCLHYFSQQRIEQNRKLLFHEPAENKSWKELFAVNSNWKLSSQGADLEFQTSYKNMNSVVDYYMARYVVSRDNAEPIDYGYSFYDKKEWRRRGLPKKITVSGNSMVEIQVRSGKFGDNRLVWYWYRVAGRSVNNKLEAKLYEGWNWITGGSGISIVVISTKYVADTTQAVATLTQFVGDIGAELNKSVDQLR